MLTLYYKPGCPYSNRVLAANQTIGAELTLRNIVMEPAARAELLAKGGRTQTPYLEDTERGVSMHESLDIISYLHTHYGKGPAPVVVPTGNVCPIE
jgi:glutathione S-transferase